MLAELSDDSTGFDVFLNPIHRAVNAELLRREVYGVVANDHLLNSRF